MSLRIRTLHRAAKILGVNLIFSGKFTSHYNQIASKGKTLWSTPDAAKAVRLWNTTIGETHEEGRHTLVIEACLAKKEVASSQAPAIQRRVPKGAKDSTAVRSETPDKGIVETDLGRGGGGY